MDNLIYKTLVNSADKWPNKVAIYDHLGQLTFKELLDEVNSMKELILSTGIEKNRAIGLICPNDRKAIIGIFAIVACDCTVMPIALHLTPYEVNEAITRAQLSYVVEEKSIDKEVEAELIFESESLRIRQTEIKETFAPSIDRPAFMRFTSGTTGQSKGVIISQKSALERVECANKELRLATEDTVVWVLPIAYHFVVSILLYIRYGVAISIVENFMAQNILESIKKHKGTLLYCSPMQIRLLSNDSSKEMIPSMHTIISTSAGISKDVCVAFKKRFNKEVSQAYGLIEVGLPIINKQKSEASPESVGYALPDYDVEILDEDFKPVPEGQIGMLGMRGPGMFDAYLDPFMKKEEVLKNGYFITSDLAVKQDGLITVQGRTKSVINISGNKVFPEEVEAVLEEFKGVKQAKVSGVPHPLLGTIIQADVVYSNDDELDIEELISFCRKRMTHFKAPQKVQIVDSIELTLTGKIKR